MSTATPEKNSFALTIFPSIYETDTTRRMSFNTFQDLAYLLEDLSGVEGYKPRKGEKSDQRSSPLITPAIFHTGKGRANKNVIGWAKWCALDIDDYPNHTPDQVLDLFTDYRFVCYSSASSKKEHPKFRIVLELDEFLPADKIRHFWHGLNKKFAELTDPQTKDFARMYYVPAIYPEACNFFIDKSMQGKVVIIDEILSTYPYIERTGNSFLDTLPEAVRNHIIEHRKNCMQNKNKYHWTGYRDCPFVNQRFIAEYKSLTNTGWYGVMYKIMASIASRAVRKGYPITSHEIASLCKELDAETGCWYKNRPMLVESERAIAFALKNL